MEYWYLTLPGTLRIPLQEHPIYSDFEHNLYIVPVIMFATSVNAFLCKKLVQLLFTCIESSRGNHFTRYSYAIL